MRSGTLARCGGARVLGAYVLLQLLARAQDIKPEEDTHAEVQVAQGRLRGQWVLGAAGTALRYAAFRGVPFAQPPVDVLRFRAPRPAASWEGVREATEEGPVCPQGHPDLEEGVRGEEDCLYLNVYTTALPPDPPSTPAPVLFFIHGGGFYKGSASAIDLGPELLLQHGLVVVTVNYRLGPLGFANLDSEGVPGNAGLKGLEIAEFLYCCQGDRPATPPYGPCRIPCTLSTYKVLIN